MMYTQEIENKMPRRLSIFYKKFMNTEKDYVLLKDNVANSFHVYDTKEEIEYVIDGEAVHNNEDDLDEYGGILFKELFNLLDIELIKEMAWKKYNKQGTTIL